MATIVHDVTCLQRLSTETYKKLQGGVSSISLVPHGEGMNLRERPRVKLRGQLTKCKVPVSSSIDENSLAGQEKLKFISLKLKMIIAQVIETSVAVNNSSTLIPDYTRPAYYIPPLLINFALSFHKCLLRLI